MKISKALLFHTPICLAIGLCLGASLVATGESPQGESNRSRPKQSEHQGKLLLSLADTKPRTSQDPQNSKDEEQFTIPAAEKPFWESAQAFVDAYSNRDAKAIGELFTEDAEFLDEFGEMTKGREAIIEMFQDVFDTGAQAMIEQIHIDRVKPINESVVFETGEIVASDYLNGPVYRNGYVAIHLKGDDGKWRINTLKDRPREEGNRRDQLEQLSWLVGSWVNEDDESVVHTDCEWSEDGNFLLRNFTVETYDGRTLKGVQRIGWDAKQKKLKSWTFDSEGGHLTGEWTRDGNRWLLVNSGVNAEGKSVSGTAVYTVIDEEMITWQLQNMIIGEEIVSEGPLVTMVRPPPAPKGNENQ